VPLLLTLIATPVIYSWLDDAAHSRMLGWVWRALEWRLVQIDRLVSR